MAGFAFDAFISYAHEDVGFARELVNWLRRSGFKVWLDEEQIIPGSRFRERLEAGIRASRHLIAVLTKDYVARPWTQREIDLFDLRADQGQRSVLAVTIGEIRHRSLDQVFQVHQRIAWKNSKFDSEGFWLLYCGLKREAPGSRAEWSAKGAALLPPREKPKGAPRRAPATVGKPAALLSEGRNQRAANWPSPRSGIRAAAAEWASVGPTNIGGRATCIVVHPSRPDVVWLGSAGGGVWKSEDAGRIWRPQWHKQESLSIGCLALDPRDPDVLWAGTGEANLSEDCMPGAGLYRSGDGGSTWALAANAKELGLPKYIGTMAIDPFDSAHLRVGGVAPAPEDSGGMFASHDGGASWQRENVVSQFSYHCHSIVFHPVRRGVIFAAFDEHGARSGIWRSRDGGKTWDHLRKGLPDPARFRRISLVIARSRPDTVYALAADQNDGLLGIFASSDVGTGWKKLGGRTEAPMSFNSAIAVHPEDDLRLVWGGNDLYTTADGGRTWRQATRWTEARGSPKYAHAAHHGIAISPTTPERIYDANGGGLDVSDDWGKNWFNRSNGLAITLFYGVDVAPSDPRAYGGGGQGTGTTVTTTGRPDDHFELLGGSGGWLAFDPKDAGSLYASYQMGGLYRFRGGSWRDISPHVRAEEQALVWMAVSAIDPENADTLFTAYNRVWRSRDGGRRWRAASAVLDGTSITALTVIHAKPERVHAGTSLGGLFRSLDGGDTWTGADDTAKRPRVPVTCLRASKADRELIFAALAGGDNSHVFCSTDGGASWTDVDRGRLPRAPVRAIAIPSDPPETVFVAGAAGVFVSSDLGRTWRDLTGNLPNTLTTGLMFHEGEGALYVATYGRSIWRLQVR